MIKILNNCIYFDIVAKSMSHAFHSLDIHHEIVSVCEPDDEASLYVIFTTHHLHEALPKRYISYNFEQLITEKTWPPEFFRRLKNAHQVWDYSLENIKVLQKQGEVDALHVPFGYSPVMDVKVKAFHDRSFDWLMLGAISPLRAEKLQALVRTYANKPEKFMVTNNCWGRDLERVYIDTKVGINLHYYPGNTILEVHRVIPMIANKIFVVSERSSDPWYDAQYKSIITFLTRGSESLLGAVSVASNMLSTAAVEAELEKRAKILKEKCNYLAYIKDKLSQMKLGENTV